MREDQAAILALHNKARLLKAVKCGCFGCYKIFNIDQITEWTDQDDTALCPYCRIDCVIPDEDNTLTEAFLKRANEYWFN